MTTKHVVADDVLGQVARKQHELIRRVLEGALEVGMVLNSLQLLIEGKFAVGSAVDVPPPVQKFEILKSLGVLEVSAGYVHGTRLEDFRQRHQCGKKTSFYNYNDGIADANFSNPSRVVNAGEKFRVDVVRQVVSGSTTSEERMAFLASQGGVLLGAQGASLVFDDEGMRAGLPKGRWYLSFDEKDRLWLDTDGDHRVPYIYAPSDGDFGFSLGLFEGPLYDVNCLLLFRDSTD